MNHLQVRNVIDTIYFLKLSGLDFGLIFNDTFTIQNVQVFGISLWATNRWPQVNIICNCCEHISFLYFVRCQSVFISLQLINKNFDLKRTFTKILQILANVLKFRLKKLVLDILFLQKYLCELHNIQLHFVTSWCSGRLIGSPRQRSRDQDPISNINIHEGGH